jgi:hypothetical protein
MSTSIIRRFSIAIVDVWSKIQISPVLIKFVINTRKGKGTNKFRKIHVFPLRTVKVEDTLRLTVSQYVLVSSTLAGLATRYYFLLECYLKFEVLFLWGALSDERMGLKFAV